MCLNETYSRVCIGKNLSVKFAIQNGLKQGDALSPLLFNFTLEYAIVVNHPFPPLCQSLCINCNPYHLCILCNPIYITSFSCCNQLRFY
jgi:hypothetical protein